MFFLSCTPTNLEVWAVAVPGQREKSLVLQLVANEQDNWAILTIKSSVRLNWGLFRHSISYMVSLWRRNTTDTPTLHRINNVCCAVARRRKILPEVYALFKKSFRDVSEMSIFDRLSQKNDPHLNLLGKMNLPTPCWKNWNSFDRYAGCFNFAFSSGCNKTVHKLTNE